MAESVGLINPPGEVYCPRGIRIITNTTVSKKPLTFTFYAYGHPGIVSTHPTTLEITAEEHVTSRGDCIVAVRSSCGLRDLPFGIKKRLSDQIGRGRLTIRVREMSFSVDGVGAKSLSFDHPTDIVVRKSGFLSDRTLMVYADKAAIDVPRKIVKILQNPDERVIIEISTAS